MPARLFSCVILRNENKEFVTSSLWILCGSSWKKSAYFYCFVSKKVSRLLLEDIFLFPFSFFPFVKSTFVFFFYQNLDLHSSCSNLSPSTVQFFTLQSSVHFWRQQWHNPQTFSLRWPLLWGWRARAVQKRFPGGWMVLVTRVDDGGYGSCWASAELQRCPHVCNKPTVLGISIWRALKVQGPGQKPLLLISRAILAGGDVCCCKIFGKPCGNIY